MAAHGGRGGGGRSDGREAVLLVLDPLQEAGVVRSCVQHAGKAWHAVLKRKLPRLVHGAVQLVIVRHGPLLTGRALQSAKVIDSIKVVASGDLYD